MKGIKTNARQCSISSSADVVASLPSLGATTVLRVLITTEPRTQKEKKQEKITQVGNYSYGKSEACSHIVCLNMSRPEKVAMACYGSAKLP